MCLAIYKPKGKLVAGHEMRNAMRTNDDGWGFAARTPSGELVVRRGVGEYDSFRNALDPYMEDQVIIHFRMATHGSVKKGNCHPFMISPGLAVIHNGVIPIDLNVDKDKSDTWHFVELVLKKFYSLRRDFWVRPEFKYVIEQAVSGSKLVFLRDDGTYGIFNEGHGKWIDGIWYSNTSHQWRYVAPARQYSKKDTYAFGSPMRDDRAELEEYYREAWEKQLEEDTGLSTIGDDDTIVIDDSKDDDDVLLDESAAEREYRKILRDFGMAEAAIEDVFDTFGLLGLQSLVDIS
jgi:hypothetical protein